MRALKIVIIVLLSLLTLLLAAVGVLYGVAHYNVRKNASMYDVQPECFLPTEGRDAIHFLSVGSTDCMLLESNGLFALVDCAEDTQYPENKPNLKLTGYENKVLSYVKTHAANENGDVALEFVVGTHAHSDHIGGFDTVISDAKVNVARAYLKKYKSSYISDYEFENWDNQEVYNQMVAALKEKEVEIVSTLPTEEFAFGDFTVKFFNTGYETENRVGENDNSLGVLLKLGDKTAFLAGDIDNLSGDEDTLAPLIGEVDLLKAGHHGYTLSSSGDFVETLSPKIVVITNSLKKAHPNILWRYAVTADASVYTTVDNDGIIADFTGNDILLTNAIH